MTATVLATCLTACSAVTLAEMRPEMLMQQEAAQLIELSDAAYTTLDEDALDEISLRFSNWCSERIPAPQDIAEASAVPPLLVAASPRVVAVDAAGAWPLLVGSYSSGWRGWTVNWAQNARVVIADLDTGRVITRLLEASKKRQRAPLGSMGRAMPNDFDAATIAAGVEMYRPFGTVVSAGSPLPARFASTVLVYDWRSNTVSTTVIDPAAPASSVHAKRPSAFSSPDVQVINDPSSSQELTPRPGTLQAPSRVEPGAEFPVVVNLDLDMKEGAATAPDARPEASRHDVLLAVTVLLLKRDAHSPHAFDLWVPGRLQGTEGPGQRVVTTFSIDVNKHYDTTELRGLLQVYVVSGSTVIGPQPVILGDFDGPEALLYR